MNSKKILFFGLVLFLIASMVVYAVPSNKGKRKAALTFNKGDMFITPQIGFNTWSIPFGANFELAITENIGVGGTLMVWFWTDAGFSATMIAPSAEGAYHFTQLEVDKLDLSAGGGIGFAIYSSTGGGGASAIYPYFFVNGRYFFQPKIAVNLRFNFSFGTWSSYGFIVGVTFRL